MEQFSGKLTLRPALKSDYDFLYSLHCLVLKEYIMQTWSWDESWQRNYFDEHFTPEDREIIQWEDRPIGVLCVQERDAETFLANIALLPDFQRRGIGESLIRQVQRQAFSAGKPVTLHVLRVNPARRLYERLGFRVIRETPERFYMQADPPHRLPEKDGDVQDD